MNNLAGEGLQALLHWEQLSLLFKVRRLQRKLVGVRGHGIFSSKVTSCDPGRGGVGMRDRAVCAHSRETCT